MVSAQFEDNIGSTPGGLYYDIGVYVDTSSSHNCIFLPLKYCFLLMKEDENYEKIYINRQRIDIG